MRSDLGVCPCWHAVHWLSLRVVTRSKAWDKGWLNGAVRRSGGLPTHVRPPPCGTGQGCEGDLTGPDHESASIRGRSTPTAQGRIDPYASSIQSRLAGVA